MGSIKKILRLFSPSQRRRAMIILFMAIAMAVIETFSIFSIMPFIALLSNPEAIQKNSVLSYAYDVLGQPDVNQFMIYAGIAVLFILVVSNLISAMTYRAITYFTYNQCDVLARRLLVGYLRQPYRFFLKSNTSVLNNAIRVEVPTVVKNVLLPAINNVAKLVIVLFILALLVVVNPLLTFIVLLVLGGSYSIIYLFIHKKLTHTGAQRVYMTLNMSKILGGTLNAAKEIKVLGKEQEFVDRFSIPSSETAKFYALHETLSTLPRYFLETVAFGAILISLLFFIGFDGNIDDVLPTVALYAFAGQRLMPAMQSIFSNMAKIQSSLASVNLVLAEIAGATPKLYKPTDTRLVLNHSISIKNLSYRYDGFENNVLDNISLDIPSKGLVAFVGGTGAGKTTLADIVLGVLDNYTGSVYLDQTLLTPENMRAWQNNVGYVPQRIVLFDDTIIRNIACGVPDDKINLSLVERAARIANIHDFIQDSLPQKYNSLIGENGVQLSGGQRQRLAIARAVYHDPDVLIFDEATSALDNITEESVMDAINRLAKDKTIIMIAHRFSTIRKCDHIFMMENGHIVGQGRYDDLLITCPSFRFMAEITREDRADLQV